MPYSPTPKKINQPLTHVIYFAVFWMFPKKHILVNDHDVEMVFVV